ncbi:MAG: methionine adenosyltransferase [Gammaproteobacteria bacterium]|jgi:S-adenosylmethionine synthetase
MSRKSHFIFVSESVTRGHPDKLCDQISDAIVDRFLAEDPCARIDAECAVSNGVLFVATQANSRASVDVTFTARQTIAGIGYTPEELDSENCTILTTLGDNLAARPSDRHEVELSGSDLDGIVAGQHATVFGYACDQTDCLMPAPIVLAHDLCRQIDQVRMDAELTWLGADAKAQVAVEYVDRRPARIHSVSLTVTGDSETAGSNKQIRENVEERIIRPALETRVPKADGKTRVFVNTGIPLVRGGPRLHSGLTGRKNAVDTYGEYARHSGAALSGKDIWRIDRIGAYAARHAAKNAVAAGLCRQCEVALSYTVGQSAPMGLAVDTFGTGEIDDDQLADRLRETMDFRVGGILKSLRLREAVAASGGNFFRRLAAYGQVGRADLDLPWEDTGSCRKLA